MTLDNKRSLLLEELDANIDALNKAAKTVSYSQNRCQSIITKTEHSEAELESCEALTSRFARAADLLTQKLLTNIFLLLQETPKTFIDKCNLAEKIGIIDSANNLMEIRALRNEIAHEYRTEIMNLFATIAKHTDKLMTIIQNVNDYAAELKNKLT